MRNLVVCVALGATVATTGCLEHLAMEAARSVKYNVRDHPATQWKYDQTYAGEKLHWYALYCGQESGGYAAFNAENWRGCMAENGFNLEELSDSYQPFGTEIFRPTNPNPTRRRFGK